MVCLPLGTYWREWFRSISSLNPINTKLLCPAIGSSKLNHHFKKWSKYGIPSEAQYTMHSGTISLGPKFSSPTLGP